MPLCSIKINLINSQLIYFKRMTNNRYSKLSEYLSQRLLNLSHKHNFCSQHVTETYEGK